MKEAVLSNKADQSKEQQEEEARLLENAPFCLQTPRACRACVHLYIELLWQLWASRVGRRRRKFKGSPLSLSLFFPSLFYTPAALHKERKKKNSLSFPPHFFQLLPVFLFCPTTRRGRAPPGPHRQPAAVLIPLHCLAFLSPRSAPSPVVGGDGLVFPPLSREWCMFLYVFGKANSISFTGGDSFAVVAGLGVAVARPAVLPLPCCPPPPLPGF